jgi:hypothetical protein
LTSETNFSITFGNTFAVLIVFIFVFFAMEEGANSKGFFCLRGGGLNLSGLFIRHNGIANASVKIHVVACRADERTKSSLNCGK